MPTKNANKQPPTSDTHSLPLYQQVLPLTVLRVLAVGSLIFSMCFIVLGIFDSSRFEDEMARFMLCLAVATLLAIFFFIFYPQQIEMKLPLMLGTTLRVTGPAALWVGVFLFLLRMIPSPEYGRVFEVWKDGRPGGMYLGDETTTYLTVKEGKPPDHKLIGAADGTRNLFGIYVLFPKNQRRIEARFHHEGWVLPLDVALTRDGSNVIDLSSVSEKGSVP